MPAADCNQHVVRNWTKCMNPSRPSEAVACYRRPTRVNRLLNRPERGCLTGGVHRQPSQVGFCCRRARDIRDKLFAGTNGKTDFGAGPAPKFSRRRVSDFLSLHFAMPRSACPGHGPSGPFKSRQYPRVPLTLTVLLLLCLCLFPIVHSSPDSPVITPRDHSLLSKRVSAGRWSHAACPFRFYVDIRSFR
jgi:hypothetical protein